MVLDDFLDDEGQEFLCELGIQIRFFREPFKAFDLVGLARHVTGREVMFCFQATDGLCLLEPFGKGVDKDGPARSSAARETASVMGVLLRRGL